MKRIVIFYALVCLIGFLLAVVTSHASPLSSLANKAAITELDLTPSIAAKVNGKDVALDVKVKQLGNGTFVAHANDIVDKAAFDLTLIGQADPAIFWTAAMNNAGSPTDTNFNFVFVQPFVGGPYLSLLSSTSGSTTAGADNDVNLTNYNLKVGATNVFFDHLLNAGCHTVGTSGVCSFSDLVVNPLSPPTEQVGNLSVNFGMTVSKGDLATFNGKLVVDGHQTAVPEPSGLVLLGSGLCLVGWAIKRHRHA